MKVKFRKSGGPFSDAPPVGKAFRVNPEDVDKTIYEITDDAFKLLSNAGAYELKPEKSTTEVEKKQDAPHVKDKKRAERR
ncbi:MAG: hypothetical protein OEM38_00455 [Gammaproteobacteria bacterium]|nr:hypothetical protein [Gammaproteobacteria bacterium]